jgi:hypothetical protein
MCQEEARKALLTHLCSSGHHRNTPNIDRELISTMAICDAEELEPCWLV